MCKRSVSNREKENNKFLEEILTIYDHHHNGTYGSFRI